MDNNAWYDCFLDALYKKHPKKPRLAQELMELLFIEREAVYRRLRKDVMFPIHEITKISAAWNISLDEITGIISGQIPFKMHLMNYIDPSEQEVSFMQQIIQYLNYLKDFPDTEFMDICNKLPRQTLSGFNYLNQFYLFKWMYEYGNGKDVVPFSKIIVSEEKRRLTAEYHEAIKQVPNSNFIWDRMLFNHLIDDILYFHSINLITDEEKELIKKDLDALLSYMLEVTTKGCYPETQNKVNFYVSRLSVDTNYSYTYTNLANMCFFHVFEKYEIYTYEPKIVADIRTWMQLKKRTSIQISEVDEKGRIEYFTRQRELLKGW
jgi:hypothetical protein